MLRPSPPLSYPGERLGEALLTTRPFQREVGTRSEPASTLRMRSHRGKARHRVLSSHSACLPVDWAISVLLAVCGGNFYAGAVGILQLTLPVMRSEVQEQPARRLRVIQIYRSEVSQQARDFAAKSRRLGALKFNRSKRPADLVSLTRLLPSSIDGSEPASASLCTTATQHKAEQQSWRPAPRTPRC